MTVIHLAFDSSSLREKPPWSKSPDFATLTRLAKAGQVQIHLPHVVLEEFQSGYEEDIHRGLVGIRSRCKKLRRREIPPETRRHIEGLASHLEEVEPRLRTHLEVVVVGWLQEVGAQIHPIGSEHGSRVMSNYFAGEPPFRRQKSRDDLPDAFVLESFRDVASETGALLVVVRDQELRKACKALGGAQVVESVAALLDLEPLHALYRQDAGQQSLEHLGRYLADNAGLLESKIAAELPDFLAGHTVEGEYLPDIHGEGVILSVGEPALEDVERVHYYGDGKGVLSALLTVECLVSFFVPKADYYALGEEMNVPLASDWNEHTFVLEAEEVLGVEIDVALCVDPKQIEDGPQPEALLREASLKIDSLGSVFLDDPAATTPA